jgi:hypothetical protein
LISALDGFVEYSFKPHNSGLTILARDIIDVSAVTKCISQCRYLSEPDGERLLGTESILELRPMQLVYEYFFKLAKVGKFKLSRQKFVASGIESRVTLGFVCNN